MSSVLKGVIAVSKSSLLMRPVRLRLRSQYELEAVTTQAVYLEGWRMAPSPTTSIDGPNENSRKQSDPVTRPVSMTFNSTMDSTCRMRPPIFEVGTSEDYF